ncbi:class I SAM-dependent methyltransferase [Streptomyces tuirus]|uniref:Class I SAM-dependent methyltransferase n=1 Tax=Streptomyces tuirus TaxID=68278 RepID=A0A941J1P9_9ACTN|nr:class I SAM-dependent methyltransferase [Streptomyces tuirus]
MEAGCGDGLLTASSRPGAASVTGVDRSPEMIELAREHGLKPGRPPTGCCPAATGAARCCGATSWCGTDHEKAAPELSQEPPRKSPSRTAARRLGRVLKVSSVPRLAS